MKKKTKPTRIVDDTDSTVNDFKLRIPFWSYRAVPYREYEPFANLQPVIDDYLAKLFQGEIDDGNGDVLDNTICDMARQAEKDLDRQHTEHGDVLKSFDIRSKGDQRSFIHDRAELLAELEENQRQLEEIRSRVKRDKFIGGKKNERPQ